MTWGMRASFARELARLDDVFRFVGAFFDATKIDPAERFPIDFAAEEIFTNYVKYNQHGSGEIEIALDLRDGEIVMELVDPDSERFDIRSDAPEVDAGRPLEQREAGGLGVHLVRKMMDRVDYRHEQRKSTVTLHKRLGENHARD